MTPANQMTDERQGLPSASKFEIVAACAGQPQLEAQLRSEQKIGSNGQPDEYQARGLRIHAAREFMDESHCKDDEEKEIFKRGLENEKAAFLRWHGGLLPDITPITEQRLWLKWPDGSNATSARLDVLYVSGDKCLIIEWKTLWCRHLTPAERNYQGAVQAVLCKAHFDAKHIRVVFNKAMLGKTDIVDYDEYALQQAEDMVYNKLWQATQEGAQTHAGPHCHYCPCKPYCRSAAAYAMLPSVVAGIDRPLKKADVEEMVSLLVPGDWAYIQRRAATIRNILDSANYQLKQINEETRTALGFRLTEGKKLDRITDVEKVFNLLTVHLPEADVWAAMELHKGKIIEAVMKGKSMTKEAATEWVKEKLAPYTETKRSDGSLEEL